MLTNETSAALPIVPDAHGQAALLLVESLLHGLCEKSTLSVTEAVEIAERAVSVQSDVADAADGDGSAPWQAHTLLLDIAASLRIDVPGAPVTPHLVR